MRPEQVITVKSRALRYWNPRIEKMYPAYERPFILRNSLNFSALSATTSTMRERMKPSWETGRRTWTGSIGSSDSPFPYKQRAVMTGRKSSLRKDFLLRKVILRFLWMSIPIYCCIEIGIGVVLKSCLWNKIWIFVNFIFIWWFYWRNIEIKDSNKFREIIDIRCVWVNCSKRFICVCV